jgi:hypothetical protein
MGYRADDGRDVVRVTLSRRNLRALLAKLDGYPPGSARTIERDDDAALLQVVAEEDDAHYAGREPGPAHPETEAAMRGAALDDEDDLCDNCVTPWKCNGPHVPRAARVK